MIYNWPVLKTAITNNWISNNYKKIQTSEENSDIKKLYKNTQNENKSETAAVDNDDLNDV